MKIYILDFSQNDVLLKSLPCWVTFLFYNKLHYQREFFDVWCNHAWSNWFHEFEYQIVQRIHILPIFGKLSVSSYNFFFENCMKIVAYCNDPLCLFLIEKWNGTVKWTWQEKWNILINFQKKSHNWKILTLREISPVFRKSSDRLYQSLKVINVSLAHF